MESHDKSQEESKKPKPKKRMTRSQIKLNYFGPVEKRLSNTENKIEKMRSTIEEELKRVELEWLHLKGMIPRINNTQIEDKRSPTPEINLDDATQINELECDFGISSNVQMKEPYSESESEMSDNGSDGEDYSTANVFN